MKTSPSEKLQIPLVDFLKHNDYGLLEKCNELNVWLLFLNYISNFFETDSFIIRGSSIAQALIKMYADLFSLEAAKIIYYGSEIGMKNEVFYKHPRDTREYVRGDFDWELAQSQNEDPHSILSLVKARISQNK